jgi:hypothetical protein
LGFNSGNLLLHHSILLVTVVVILLVSQVVLVLLDVLLLVTMRRPNKGRVLIPSKVSNMFFLPKDILGSS